MAVNPPSDIVLGAVLAADPAKYQAAAERLRRAAGAAGAGAASSSAIAEDWRTTTTADASAVPAQGRSAAPSPQARASQGGRTPDAFGQLEAFVLQSFIQTMLPKDSQTFFGKGTAGEVWKSMLAEKLGAQIAGSNQLGLAKRLAAGRSAAVASPVSVTAFGVPARASASLMSALPFVRSTSGVAAVLSSEGESTAERS